MTKLLIAAVFSMVFVGSAIAADLPTDARVPTGIDVRGTVDYKLCKGRVVQQTPTATWKAKAMWDRGLGSE
jgi:hypothetical protein